MKNYMYLLVFTIFFTLNIIQSFGQFRSGRRSSGFGSRNSGWGKMYNKPVPLKSSGWGKTFSSNKNSMFTPQRQRIHGIYKKYNPDTKMSYFGRTSGYGSKQSILAKREKSHHMSKKGYTDAKWVKTSTNPNAIRGAEQYFIENNKKRGRSGNAINSIHPKNPKKQSYMDEAKKAFRLPNIN